MSSFPLDYARALPLPPFFPFVTETVGQAHEGGERGRRCCRFSLSRILPSRKQEGVGRRKRSLSSVIMSRTRIITHFHPGGRPHPSREGKPGRNSTHFHGATNPKNTHREGKREKETRTLRSVRVERVELPHVYGEAELRVAICIPPTVCAERTTVPSLSYWLVTTRYTSTQRTRRE